MTAYIGNGVTLAIKISGSFVTLGSCVSIDGPELGYGSVDVTNLATGYKKNKSTIPDPGTVSATLQFDPGDTTINVLVDLISAYPQADSDWQLMFTDTDTHAFTWSGFLTKVAAGGVEAEGVITLDLEITNTTIPVLA